MILGVIVSESSSADHLVASIPRPPLAHLNVTSLRGLQESLQLVRTAFRTVDPVKRKRATASVILVGRCSEDI